MTQVLAKGELLESVSILVAIKADEAANDPIVSKLVSVGDHSHLDELILVDTLLDHVVDAVFAQSLHCCLVLCNGLLDVLDRILVHLLGHLWVMIVLSEHLQGRLFDLGRLLDLRVSVADETDVAEDQHVGKDEPED